MINTVIRNGYIKEDEQIGFHDVQMIDEMASLLPPIW